MAVLHGKGSCVWVLADGRVSGGVSTNYFN